MKKSIIDNNNNNDNNNNTVIMVFGTKIAINPKGMKNLNGKDGGEGQKLIRN